MRLPKFATVRITVLLIALFAFGIISLIQLIQTRSWEQTLQITVFPINADNHVSTAGYINALSGQDFAIIDLWSERQARRYNLDLMQPFDVELGAQIDQLPPPWPKNDNPIAVIFWGLRFRWWAYRNTPDDGGGITRIRMFVMYQVGENDQPLSHSLGMQKGLLGLVHAYAIDEQTDQNNVVIAHEVMHTVGAIDKYTEFGNPSYPIGFTQPYQEPLYPQRYAEIMTGRIATGHNKSYMANSLRSVQVNAYTANEINWSK